MELKLAAHDGGERRGVLPDGHHHHRLHPRVPLLPAHPCLDVRRQVEEERGGGEDSKLPPLFDFPLRRVLVETSRLSLPRRPRLAMPLPRWRTTPPTTNLNNNHLPAGKLGRGRSLRPAESSRSPSTALLSHPQPLLVALHGVPSLPTSLLSPLQAALLPTLSVNSVPGLAEEPRAPQPPIVPLPSSSEHHDGHRQHKRSPGHAQRPQPEPQRLDGGRRRTRHPVQRLLPCQPPKGSQQAPV